MRLGIGNQDVCLTFLGNSKLESGRDKGFLKELWHTKLMPLMPSSLAAKTFTSPRRFGG
ncbi:MAG: hypothetical protein ACI87E_004418 [Mariniblastus sp.]|jgi:hypothetical protein